MTYDTGNLLLKKSYIGGTKVKIKNEKEESREDTKFAIGKAYVLQ
jgi:hypothetical protein